MLLKTQKRLLAAAGKLRLAGVNRHLQDIFRLFRVRPDLRDRAGAASLAHQLFRPSRVIVDNDTDQALVERYRNGDREAFTELVVRYQRPIYNAAFWVLRKAEDANDVAQNVFLKVAERLDDYDPQYKFFSWIYRIAVNESLNLLRRNGREEALDDEIDLPAARGSEPGVAGSARPQRAGQDPERADEHDDQRPDGADAAALFRMQLPGDRADPGPGREDGEIPPVRGAAPPARHC